MNKSHLIINDGAVEAGDYVVDFMFYGTCADTRLGTVFQVLPTYAIVWVYRRTYCSAGEL